MYRLASFLPSVGGALGTLIGGPAGAVVGTGAGKALQAIAEFFGVEPTKEAVSQAVIGASPDQMIQLQIRLKELDTQSELERLKLREKELANRIRTLESINATMRIEATSESWWQRGWRPYWGFMSANCFVAQFVWMFYMVATGRGGQIAPVISALAAIWPFALAVLGVATWQRDQVKKLRLQQGLPGSSTINKKTSSSLADRVRRMFGDSEADQLTTAE